MRIRRLERWWDGVHTKLEEVWLAQRWISTLWVLWIGGVSVLCGSRVALGLHAGAKVNLWRLLNYAIASRFWHHIIGNRIWHIKALYSSIMARYLLSKSSLRLMSSLRKRSTASYASGSNRVVENSFGAYISVSEFVLNLRQLIFSWVWDGSHHGSVSWRTQVELLRDMKTVLENWSAIGFLCLIELRRSPSTLLIFTITGGLSISTLTNISKLSWICTRL